MTNNKRAHMLDFEKLIGYAIDTRRLACLPFLAPGLGAIVQPRRVAAVLSKPVDGNRGGAAVVHQMGPTLRRRVFAIGGGGAKESARAG